MRPISSPIWAWRCLGKNLKRNQSYELKHANIVLGCQCRQVVHPTLEQGRILPQCPTILWKFQIQPALAKRFGQYLCNLQGEWDKCDIFRIWRSATRIPRLSRPHSCRDLLLECSRPDWKIWWFLNNAFHILHSLNSVFNIKVTC